MWIFSSARRCARLAVFGLAAMLAEGAAAFPNAYILDSTGNINVVDTSSNQIVGTIKPVILPPFLAQSSQVFNPGIALSPDGQSLYISTIYGVEVASTSNNLITGQFPSIGGMPAISPDGNWIYASTASVFFFDIANDVLVSTIGSGILPVTATTVSPDGRRLYVGGSQSTGVTVIDIRDTLNIATIGVDAGISAIVVSPDNQTVWIANPVDGTITIVDAASNISIANFALGTKLVPNALAFSPDGTKVYVATSGFTNEGCLVLNASTHLPVAVIPVPGLVHQGIAITPDGSTLYITGNDTNAVYAVSTSAQTVVATVNLPGSPLATTGFVGGNAPPAQNVTLSASITTGGMVSSTPPGIYCVDMAGSCASASFAPGTQVTLTAAPYGNNGFAGWQGDCSGATATCTLTMDAMHSVNTGFAELSGAAFELQVLNGSYYATGAIITSSPPGINCPPNCQALFPANTNVALTTTLMPGYGDFYLYATDYYCTNVNTPCNFVLVGPATLQAFTTATNEANTSIANYYFLNVFLNGQGTVVSSPAGISCSPGNYAGIWNFNPYESVTLSETPSPGYMFTGWGIGAATQVPANCPLLSNTCTVTMNQVIDVTASFEFIVPQAGYWWNPAEPGRGYNIEQQGDTVFMAAFLYDTSGRATWWGAGPAPLTAGSFTASLFAATGGPQLTGPYKAPTSTLQAGSIAVSFTSPTTAIATFGGNTFPIQRFDFGPGGAAGLQSPGAPETGWWWAASEPGRGFAIEVQQGTMFIAGYMYDSSGSPIWYASGPAPMTNATSYTGTWTQFANGETISGPWQAAQVANADAGNITIVFSSSNTGMLSFPDSRTVLITRFKF